MKISKNISSFMYFVVHELVGRLGECVARQTVRWDNVYNAVPPQFQRLLCLGWSCHGLLLSVVPMVSGKMCWGEKVTQGIPYKVIPDSEK